jgi:hypothetical protein
VRFEERETPTIIKPTDAIIRIPATCDRSDADGPGEDPAQGSDRVHPDGDLFQSGPQGAQQLLARFGREHRTKL